MAVADHDKENNDLPEFIDITEAEVERYYSIWAWWRATDRKHLISDIMQEPHEAMAAVLEIDRIYEKILGQLAETADNEE